MAKSASKPKSNVTKPVTIQFKALVDGAVPPTRSDDYAIGFDIIVPENIRVPAHSRFFVPMGFAIGLPRNIEGKIEGRSGFSGKGIEGYGEKWVWGKLWGWLPVPHKESGKLRFDCDVKVGKIDPGYKGEVNVIVKNNDVSFVIPKGTKLAQMTFYRVPRVVIDEVEELTGFDRGGGLGHTGARI